jgi:phospholipid/cholesterol/gamma-HCH transport system substrate-binding protein
MQNNTRKEAVLGALFVVAIIFLIFISITISKLPIFHHPQYIKVRFNSVSGLKKGDPVRVLGMETGSVYKLKFLSDNTIKVTLKLFEPVNLREDYKITIEESSMLGGNLVGINPGTPGKNDIDPKTILKGEVVPPGLSTFGRFIEEKEEDVTQFLKDAITIVRDTAVGKGTLGKFIRDDSLYIELKETSQLVKNIVKKAESGEGSLGKFISDDKLYIDLKKSVESLKKTLKQIESNQGLLGKVIYDEKLAKDITDAGDTVTKILEPAVKTKVFAGVCVKSYPESAMTVSDVFIHIEPKESKYFILGGSIFSLNKRGNITFEDQSNDRDQTFIKADAQIAYKFLGNMATFITGLIEGKFGGAIDLDLNIEEIVSDSSITGLSLSFEMRDAFNSLRREDIDENLPSALSRAYASIKLGNHFKTYLGLSRLFSGTPEYIIGISFEYLDEDIKSFVTLLGLSR